MEGTVTLPSRTYPKVPGNPTADLRGGARGPAALPARIDTDFPIPGPPTAGGAFGVVADTRRSAAIVSSAGRSPGVQMFGHPDNEVFHDTINWRRFFFPNDAGAKTFRPPTPQPSWSANGESVPYPITPVPSGRKHITWGTTREEYGSTRQFWGDGHRNRGGDILSSSQVQRPRWRAQAKTANPWPVLLTRYGLAGSYGSTTRQLATAPQNAVAGSPGMGAY